MATRPPDKHDNNNWQTHTCTHYIVYTHRFGSKNPDPASIYMYTHVNIMYMHVYARRRAEYRYLLD